MGRKRVLLKGGLGNQLFQWGFAHLLRAQGHRVSLVAFENRLNSSFDISQHSRFLLLRNIMENCNCVDIETVYLDLPVYRVLRDPEARWNPFRVYPNFLRNFDSNSFQFIEINSVSKVRNFSGYYQNIDLLRPVEAILARELRKYLDGQDSNSDIVSNVHPHIIHIRRGDFATPPHFNTIGVLSSEYYFRATNSLNVRPWVAVTDDPFNMSDVSDRIQIEKILGPSELDTIGALRAMANAKTLVIANSTLSWWGGFLATHQGGKVVAPSSWHRRSDGSQLDVLKHDKFETVEADFFQTIHDYELSQNHLG